MKFVVITKDDGVVSAAREGFHPSDECLTFADWREALDQSQNVDLMFVDLISTLVVQHQIQGYEEFALAKMGHSTAKSIPLVVISPSDDYELDFMVGWPDFAIGNVKRPVDYRIFRRASTWV